MIRIDIATLFPDMCNAVIHESIIGRAISAGHIEISCHNIRDYAHNKHNRVDDKAYGGGTGMVMQAQPIYDCITDIKRRAGEDLPVIYMSPQGKTLTQQKVKELAELSGFIILCGHYEGVDNRVLEELQVEEISVGDYVLTGGELPALILADAVSRLQEGVLPNSDAYSIESHYDGLLEYPQYSRPEVWRGRAVPEILLTGHHENILKWQREAAFRVTELKRPDLLYNHTANNAPYAEFVRFCSEETDKNGVKYELWEYSLMLCKRRIFSNAEIKKIKRICEFFKQKNINPAEFAGTEIYYPANKAFDIIYRYGALTEILKNHAIKFEVNFKSELSDIKYRGEEFIIV